MPKKGGKKKGSKKVKKAVTLPGNETPEQVVKRLLKTYERNCVLTGTNISCDLRTTLKNSIEDNKLLEKFVLVPEPVKHPDDPIIVHVALDPLVTAMRQERYAYIKDLYVWNLPLQHDQVSALVVAQLCGSTPSRCLVSVTLYDKAGVHGEWIVRTLCAVMEQPIAGHFAPSQDISSYSSGLIPYFAQYYITTFAALLLEKGFYPVRKIELEDCLMEAYSMQRLSISFSACPTLTTINLDYNEFGDEGCLGLCAGLRTNSTVTSLSMCYCRLGVESGKVLGDMVATSTVRDLYLDGNDLECEGVVELIKLCADNAETETYEKENEARCKLEQQATAAGVGSFSLSCDLCHHLESQGYTYTSDSEKSRGGSAVSKKKKKGKKKKGKEPPLPPRVGPWIHKLHLADNGIDIYSDQGLAAPLICMRLFRKLLIHSDCFEELDLDGNLIGDLAGRELVEALLDRKEANHRGVKLQTTHRMSIDTFNNLIQLGAGMKKQKKKGTKKKKK